MESQPQNPELRNNSENFHPCNKSVQIFPACKEFRGSRTFL